MFQGCIIFIEGGGGVAEQETYSDFITPGGRGIQGVVSNFALFLFPIKSRNEGSTKGHQGVGGIQGVVSNPSSQ